MVVARKHNPVVMVVDTNWLDKTQADFVDCNKEDPFLYELDDVLVN